MTTATRDKAKRWIRVSKERRCPVCGKPDWCMISPDGAYAICPRTAEGAVREVSGSAGSAGYLHKLAKPIEGLAVAPAQGNLIKAAPIKCHEAYSSLLEGLELSPEHRENLLNRGLTQEAITYNSYKTLTADRDAVVKRVIEQTEAEGVPGFFVGTQGVELEGSPGILLPVRDLDQLIIGCQIRRDNPGDGAKYVWLSSANQRTGSSPGAPAHLALPVELVTSDWLIITEGSLKAAIVAHCAGCAVVGIPGVTMWRGAVDMAIKLLPRNVVIAFDMDKLSNDFVARAVKNLAASLMYNHFNAYEASWPAQYKGLDDYLAAGGKDMELKLLQKAAIIKAQNHAQQHYKETQAKSYNFAQTSVKTEKEPLKPLYGADLTNTALLEQFGDHTYGKATIRERWADLCGADGSKWSVKAAPEIARLRSFMLDLNKRREGAIAA